MLTIETAVSARAGAVFPTVLRAAVLTQPPSLRRTAAQALLPTPRRTAAQALLPSPRRTAVQALLPTPRRLAIVAVFLFALAAAIVVSGGPAFSQPTEATESVSMMSTETCLLVVPAGEAPEGGWPVFVFLHGYGTNKEDFDHVARLTAERGAAAISVDAMSDLGNGRRSWTGGAPEAHAHIQAQIEAMKDELGWDDSDLKRFDFSTLHVGGFSQGGIRSLLLVVSYPEVYGGVLSISPAGGAWPASLPPLTGSHPLRLIYGTAEGPRVAQTAETAQEVWDAAGQPWETFTHPGGHHFPGDWQVVLGDGVEWIVDTTRSANAEKK